MEQKDRMGSAREQRYSALLNLAQKLVQQFGDADQFDAQQIEKVLWQMVAAQSA